MKWATLSAALLALAVSSGSGGAQECAGLPPSNLQVQPLAADHVSEQIGTPEEMARRANSGNRPAPHPLMAIRYTTDSKVAIAHRLVPAPGGGFCDAPESVLFGFGVVMRRVILAPEAAAEPCVKSALLAHEAEHDQQMRAAIRAFIVQYSPTLVQELLKFNTQPAADEETAKQSLETELVSASARMLQRFISDEAARIIQSVDSDTRLGLGQSCNGRMKELEQSLSRAEKKL